MSMTLVARPHNLIAETMAREGEGQYGDWLRLGSDWQRLDGFLSGALPEKSKLSNLPMLPESDEDVFGPPVILPAQDVAEYANVLRSGVDQLYDVNTDFDWDGLLSLLEFCERHHVGVVFRLV